MKRISISFLLTFLLLIILSACQENKWMDWKLMNDQWLAKHKADTGFVTTSSGLCYKVIHQGLYPKKPNVSSWIIANYKGRLIDSSEFDSGQYNNYLSGAIKGWQEGIKKMNVGGSYTFYIPSALGYDTISTNSKIPPHSVLIFDVELIDSDPTVN